MRNALEEFIVKKVKNAKPEEFSEILSAFEIQKFKNGDFFKEPFTKSNEVGFIVDGAFRMILFKSDGKEVTGEILKENVIRCAHYFFFLTRLLSKLKSL